MNREQLNDWIDSLIAQNKAQAQEIERLRGLLHKKGHEDETKTTRQS